MPSKPARSAATALAEELLGRELFEGGSEEVARHRPTHYPEGYRVQSG
jgi:hypothetical protein